MTFLWILLAIVYVACCIYFGLATFRKANRQNCPWSWTRGPAVLLVAECGSQGSAAGPGRALSQSDEHPRHRDQCRGMQGERVCSR